MGDLIDFAMRVKEQFDRANRKPEWSGEEADRYMAEVMPAHSGTSNGQFSCCPP